jgi:hypothetical protein
MSTTNLLPCVVPMPSQTRQSPSIVGSQTSLRFRRNIPTKPRHPSLTTQFFIPLTSNDCLPFGSWRSSPHSNNHRRSTPNKITRACRKASSLDSSRLGRDSKRAASQSLKSIPLLSLLTSYCCPMLQIVSRSGFDQLKNRLNERSTRFKTVKSW